MPRFMLHHRHGPGECAAAFAAWKGFASPLRHHPTVASCAFGGHEIWWQLELSWRGTRDVRSYRATVRLADGRRLLIPTRRRRVTVPRVGRRVRGTAAVRGLSRSGMVGLPAVQRLPGAR